MQRTLVTMAIALCACEEPRPAPAPAPSATSRAVAKPTLPVRGEGAKHLRRFTPGRAPHGGRTADGPPAAPSGKPLDGATLAEHAAGASALRLWEIGDADAGRAWATHHAVNPKQVKALLEAIGATQTPVAKGCAPCRPTRRLALETALGVRLAALDLGCPGDPPKRARLTLRAARTCAFVRVDDPTAVEALVLKLRTAAPARPARRLP